MITIEDLTSATRRTDRGLEIRAHVHPGAQRAGITGLHDARLKIAVRQKAVDGKANQGLCLLLADMLSVRKSDVCVLRGEKSRKKVLLVRGDAAAIETSLLALLEKL